MKSEEVFFVNEMRVSCNGGDDSSHPLIYLNLLINGEAVCPYCSKIFRLIKKDHETH